VKEEKASPTPLQWLTPTPTPNLKPSTRPLLEVPPPPSSTGLGLEAFGNVSELNVAPFNLTYRYNTNPIKIVSVFS
jgi:hypothetical protein